MKQKKIKVRYRNRESGNTDTAVPMIQMTGLWLESLGFGIGDTIMLEYDDAGIRIRPLTAFEKAAAMKEALELSIRKKQQELMLLERQIGEGCAIASMAAGSAGNYPVPSGSSSR